MNIYVGNLPRETEEGDLREMFEAFGQVSSINLIRDKFSGELRGFGFVEMGSKEEGMAAIAGLNGKEMHGNVLNVNEARPRGEGGGGGGRGGFGGGGGRGGGGRGFGGGGNRGGGGGGRRF